MDRAEFEVLCRASDGYVEQLLKLVLPTRAERSLEPLAEGGYAHGVLKLSPGGIRKVDRGQPRCGRATKVGKRADLPPHVDVGACSRWGGAPTLREPVVEGACVRSAPSGR